jgi:hypothetical protein
MSIPTNTTGFNTMTGVCVAHWASPAYKVVIMDSVAIKTALGRGTTMTHIFLHLHVIAYQHFKLRQQ